LTEIAEFYRIDLQSLFVRNFSMVRFRDNRHKHSMRHDVTMQILCLHRADAVICAVFAKVAPEKEAAP